jgi:hypothetical protein
VDDTLSAKQLVMLMLVMLGSAVATAAREMLMALWMAMTNTRGDGARLVFLADLLATVCISAIGEALGQGWAGKCPCSHVPGPPASTSLCGGRDRDAREAHTPSIAPPSPH